VGPAAEALEAWLRASKIRSGPIFRAILKNGLTVGKPLKPSAVRYIVRQRCALAGLDGNYSAHSLRSGFVTEAGLQRVPPGDAMELTGHASLEPFMAYYRAGEERIAER
jgi:integrase